MTQHALAAACELTPKYISDVENGRVNPSLASIHALATRGFQLPVASLLNYEVAPDAANAAMENLRALLGSQPRDVQRRILHVIQALLEPLPD